jgi:ElaB/YqjD/DUF883 family membrane-anchored ribosome-binding protein
MSASPTEQLSEDLRALAEDAGNFFSKDEKKAADATRELRNRLAETLQSAEKTLEALNQKASDGIEATDHMIATRPYKALGVAVAIGVVIGLLAKRK